MKELYNKTYQYGNYTTLKGSEIVKINGLDDSKVTLEGEQGYIYVTGISDMVPLQIMPEILNKTGFTCIQTINELLHTRYIYEISINNRSQYLNGHVYKDKALWVFNGFNVVYFHMLQNLVKILDPRVELKLW